MMETIDTLLYRFRFLVIGVLIIASLFLLTLLLSSIEAGDSTVGDAPTSDVMNMSGSPNVIAGGMAVTADKTVRFMDSTEQAVYGSARAVESALAQSGQLVVGALSQSGKFVARSLQTSASFVAHSVSSSVAFTARTISSTVRFFVYIPANTVGFVADSALVSAVIKPANNAQVPIIDPAAIVMPANLAAAKTVGQTGPAANTEAAWPIHGQITTLFGVPHWPYQPVHTGIDISDGQRPGVTPVKPFKTGRVVETVRSYRGLGHYVVVDHGSGMTSVYAHLASISVQVGQAVDKNTVLGTEGSTGASTGTHLHFEIRLNGQPMDPRQFVGGQP